MRSVCPLQELEEFWAYKSLLSELTRRLTYCVQAELIPLMEVAGVMEVCVLAAQFLQNSYDQNICLKAQCFCFILLHSLLIQHRAKQLYNAGYKTLAHLANADPQILVRTIENLFKRQANQIIASAKVSTISHYMATFYLHISFFTCKILQIYPK